MYSKSSFLITKCQTICFPDLYREIDLSIKGLKNSLKMVIIFKNNELTDYGKEAEEQKEKQLTDLLSLLHSLEYKDLNILA
jgi:hypothetical protein